MEGSIGTNGRWRVRLGGLTMTDQFEAALHRDPGSQVWMGSSASPVHLRPAESWWCLPSAGSPGDLLVLYQGGVGIVRVERVLGPHESQEARCLHYRLRTVSTVSVLDLTVPISAAELKTHAELQGLPAVRRNFQGTWFRVPDNLWGPLRALIVKHSQTR
jgi:hypothetical protein